MFDEKMAAAVETAQKRLMNTTERESVLVALANDLSEMDGLVKKLDPSKIDFDKGGLEKLKITSYWNRFEECYPAMKAIFEKLGRSKKILHNSITTVNRFSEEFNTAYDRFKAVPEEQRDRDYLQQAAVCENMALMLKNSVGEHQTVYEHISMLLNILESSLDMAILMAKQKSDRVLGEASERAPVMSDISNISFQAQYKKLKGILG